MSKKASKAEETPEGDLGSRLRCHGDPGGTATPTKA